LGLEYLVFGFWFLVFGFWFLVFGFWFLVFCLQGLDAGGCVAPRGKVEPHEPWPETAGAVLIAAEGIEGSVLWSSNQDSRFCVWVLILGFRIDRVC
jgi:hypothetical protein